MLCLDRSLVGRISEIRGISFSQIVFAEQQGYLIVCLILLFTLWLYIKRFVRSKNDRLADFCSTSWKKWQVCPVHALGSFLALLSSPVQDAGLPFDYISACEVSGHVNALLKKLFAV